MNDPAQRVLSLCLECHKNLTSTHSECSHEDHTAHSWTTIDNSLFLHTHKNHCFHMLKESRSISSGVK